MADSNYYIQGVNGPVVTVRGGKGLAMMDMVSVGPEGLIGEVVSVENDVTTVQVYEDTTGLTPSMPVSHHPGTRPFKQHLRRHLPSAERNCRGHR